MAQGALEKEGAEDAAIDRTGIGQGSGREVDLDLPPRVTRIEDLQQHR